MCSIIRDLTYTPESLSYLLFQATGLLFTQCGIGDPAGLFRETPLGAYVEYTWAPGA
jgi:hypothetical protein